MSTFEIYVHQLTRVWAIAKKNIRIYYAKGPVVIFGILLPVFLFLSFIIGRQLSVSAMVPGLLGMAIFFTANAISPAVAPWETQARTLERLMASPVTISTIVLGDILASFIFGVAISLVPLALGLVLGVSIATPVALAVAIILAAVCFSSLGLMFSSLPTSQPSNVMMLSSVIKFPLVFISGVFVPLNELPAWGRAVSYISPLTYFVDISRHLMQGAGQLPMLLDFALLLAFTVAFTVLAIVLHQRTMPRRI
jgi:ABC-2 type transport system permease protein